MRIWNTDKEKRDIKNKREGIKEEERKERERKSGMKRKIAEKRIRIRN